MPTKRELLEALEEVYHDLGELLGYEPRAGDGADKEYDPEGEQNE